MKATIRTRLCCRSPLTNLFQKTLMFTTLILQYLNKLVECEIGDFPSPQAFHPVKVQRLNGNGIKLFAKFCCELPMKIFALVSDFTIQASDGSNTPPPAVRTFLLTTQCFVEATKFLQGLFQRLWVLFLFTCAKGQVRVFHAEVCPNTFTCCRQTFHICIVRRDTEPIVTAVVTFYRNMLNTTVPLTVFVKRIRHTIKSPFTFLPFAEGYGNPIIFQVPPRLSRKGNGLELMPLFDFRSTTKFFEKTHISIVNTPQLLLNRLARQSVPMRVRPPLEFCKVRRHHRILRIRQSVFISLTLPLMEVFMHLPHIVKQVTKTDTIRLVTKLIFIGFHGLSSIKSLTPTKWVGRHVTLRLRLVCLPT